VTGETPNAKSAEILAKLQEIEERLDKLQREERPRTLSDLIARLVPREVRQHLLAARREQLLAVEAYIDHLVQRIDEAEKHEGGHEHRRIAVE